jgi:hypothetical protein
LGIKPIELIESFGNLFVTESSLRPKHTGRRADAVFMDQRKRLLFGVRSPEFQHSFIFERSKQNGAWRISYALFL